MEDLDRYLEEIVNPTVQDFVEHPTSVRHAFLACAVTFHAVDYRAHPRAPQTLRQQWRSRSEAFRRVDEVAHAFKHVATHRQNQARLVARAIISRPPAVAGVMECGLSLIGDVTGAVTLQEDTTINLLEVVHDAVRFLRTQIAAGRTG
jgi:hypothetical protein